MIIIGLYLQPVLGIILAFVNFKVVEHTVKWFLICSSDGQINENNNDTKGGTKSTPTTSKAKKRLFKDRRENTDPREDASPPSSPPKSKKCKYNWVLGILQYITSKYVIPPVLT